MCVSKALLIVMAKGKKIKSKIRRKTPIPPALKKHNKLNQLQILREAFFKGLITKKELAEGIEEIGFF